MTLENLGIHDFWLFVAAGLLLNITPGPDAAYVAGRSLQLGWRGGVAAALGVGAGCLVHIVAAAAGLSALIAASATGFVAVKLLGAAWLCIMGLRMLLARAQPAGEAAPPPAADLGQVFRQGALTNALNPKVALFFLAFLPQFVDVGAPFKALGFLLLGLWFDVFGTLWNIGLAVATGRAAARARRSAALVQGVNRALGALFIWLGVRVALAE